LEFDDKETETVRDHRDDEYAWAGVEDPKLMITTSHNPSSRLKQFVKVGDPWSPRLSMVVWDSKAKVYQGIVYISRN
jgi:hypothetical protein